METLLTLAGAFLVAAAVMGLTAMLLVLAWRRRMRRRARVHAERVLDDLAQRIADRLACGDPAARLVRRYDLVSHDMRQARGVRDYARLVARHRVLTGLDRARDAVSPRHWAQRPPGSR